MEKDLIAEYIQGFLQEGSLTDYLVSKGYKLDKGFDPDFIDDNEFCEACEQLAKQYFKAQQK